MDGLRRPSQRGGFSSSSNTAGSSTSDTPHALGERKASEILTRQLSRGMSGGGPLDDGFDEDTAALLEDLEGLQAHISKVYTSVFKLFTTHSKPNFLTPWSQQQQFSSIGTGFCLDVKRKRFITNAHCVEDAVVVQVLKRGDTKKFFAKVLVVADACDLALLTVESDQFWKDVPELPLSPELCRLQDTVSVLGYPVGGSNISLTQGVVSRIDLTDFSQSFGTQSLLTVQIDAAINSGNSGGPVLNSRMQVVGVAFQGMVKQEAESTGYLIPGAIVQRFLEDFEKHGTFTGFTSLGIECQALENEDLRKWHGVAEEQTGIVVRAVAPEMAVARVLRANDVLLSVEGQRVGNDGSVEFLDGERIQVTHLLSTKFRGDLLHVEVLRDGAVVPLSFTLENPALLIPPKPAALSYLIVSGLVFLPLSMELLDQRYLIRRFGDMSVPPALKSLEQYCSHLDEEVVVLSQILRHEANAGYDVDELVRVTTVNGQAIRNLAHMVALVDGCQEEWVQFEFDGIKDKIVLARSRISTTTQEVCEQNKIPRARFLGGNAAGEGTTCRN